MDKNHIERTKTRHAEVFGAAAESVAFAPGRVEVLGNHTDYNEGTVLSAAIDMGHCFCISRSGRPGVRLHAADVAQTAEFDLDVPGAVDGFGWANYSKGVMAYLRGAGLEFGGLDCTFWGTIPMGAGLSSSAALEVATAYALLGLCDTEMDKTEIAKICQRAEIDFAGTNCGLLDQFSSIYGVEHGLIHSDFRSLSVTTVKLPEDAVFLMINPHVKHSLSESPYNERRERCEQAACEFDALLDHPVGALRDVSWEEFTANRDRIDAGAAKRAAHIVGEITRVEQGMELLAAGKADAFGALMFGSHESSRTEFENSCAELDITVAAAKEAGAMGARLSGGGFGGSAVALVHAADAEKIGAKIQAICEKRGGFSPEICTVIPSAGACRLTD